MYITNKNGYVYMNFMDILLCLVAYFCITSIQYSLNNDSSKSLENPYKWFCWFRKILISYIISNVCIQLISVTTCRHINILYDFRYISMIILQLTGFFICLLFSFFLGVKFAAIRPEHRLGFS